MDLLEELKARRRWLIVAALLTLLILFFKVPFVVGVVVSLVLVVSTVTAYQLRESDADRDVIREHLRYDILTGILLFAGGIHPQVALYWAAAIFALVLLGLIIRNGWQWPKLKKPSRVLVILAGIAITAVAVHAFRASGVGLLAVLALALGVYNIYCNVKLTARFDPPKPDPDPEP